MSEPAQNQGVLLVLCSWFSVQLVLSWLCAVGSAHWCAAPSFSLVAHKSCYSVIRRGQIRVFSHWLRPNQALFSLAEATLPSGRRPASALSPGCGPGCGPGLSSESRLWSPYLTSSQISSEFKFGRYSGEIRERFGRDSGDIRERFGRYSGEIQEIFGRYSLDWLEVRA